MAGLPNSGFMYLSSNLLTFVMNETFFITDTLFPSVTKTLYIVNKYTYIWHEELNICIVI